MLLIAKTMNQNCVLLFRSSNEAVHENAESLRILVS
jgi:hypothetical protein